MDAPIKWRDKVLLVEIETAYGVDPTPTGAANAILATNVVLTPMAGNDVSRNLEMPWLGAQSTIASELHATLKFNVEMVPSGTLGVAPAWGPLLRACAIAETIEAGTSVAYNPISDNHESATVYLWIGNTLFKSSGVRGTADIMMTAQGIPYLEFTLTGLFTPPSEVARAVPALAAFKKPLLATSKNTPTFTMNAIPFVMRSFKLDFANSVQNFFLIGDESVEITDRADVIDTTVRAVPLSTFDPFDLAANQATVALQLVHGTVAGLKTTIDVPTAEMQRTQSLTNTNGVMEWPLRLVPLPTVGNDQWTITLT